MCVLSNVCAGKDNCKNHGKTSQTGQNRHENRKGREKPERRRKVKVKYEVKGLKMPRMQSSRAKSENYAFLESDYQRERWLPLQDKLQGPKMTKWAKFKPV